jgi:hypothetical protein
MFNNFCVKPRICRSRIEALLSHRSNIWQS